MRGGPREGNGKSSEGDARREAAQFHDSHSPDRLPEDRLIGQTINERFKILGKLGSGGMGQVYIAYDQSADTTVALKVLNGETDDRYKWDKRFSREATAASSTNHPNVIDVSELGTFGDRKFCVMEYLEGEDLCRKLEREGRFQWKTAKTYLLQICDALEAAHGKGIIHRDMKPANVMVVNVNGNDYPLVKVLDFGLAKLQGVNDDRITREGLIIGTPKYMAPEQAWGGKYDHRADLYSLGAMMYEMLTGRPPFQTEAETERERILQMLLMHKEKPPTPPSEIERSVPKDVERVVMRALSKDPAERFGSAREMRDAILACPPRVMTAREAFPELFESMQSESNPEGELFSEPSRPAVEDLPTPLAETPRETERRHFEERLERAMERVPELPKEKKGRRGRAMLLIAAGAAAFAAYHYRAQIHDTYDAYMRQQDPPARTSQPSPPPATPARPSASSATGQPSASAGSASTFEIALDSDPRGASVYDVTGGANVYLGGTPLRLQVARGEHTLMIRHRGFIQQRKIVNPDHPSLSVTLSRVPRPVPPADSGEAGSSAPPADSSGPAPQE